MIKVLCYGDSNTWGFISGSNHQRYDENSRWTKVLQKQLGADFDVVEEGLNSRTLFSEDTRPNKEGKNGFTYLKPCLETHDKIDYFILMLGSNEFKTQYNNSTEDIFEMIKKFIGFIQNFKSQIDGTTPKLVVLGLPPVSNNKSLENDTNFDFAKEKIEKFNKLLEEFCKKNKIDFIDNSDLITGIDRTHITSESHKKLAEKVCALLKTKVRKAQSDKINFQSVVTENSNKTNLFILHSLNGDTLEFWGKDVSEFAIEKNIDCFMPKFPIRAESKYEKFDEILQTYLSSGKLNENSIVIAHSIGNAYFIRFCREHNFLPKVFVAVAPGAIYSYPLQRNDYIVEVKNQAYLKDVDFEYGKNFKNIFMLFSDEDDKNKEKFERFEKDFNAKPIYLKGYNHFDDYHRIYKIPELIDLLNDLI